MRRTLPMVFALFCLTVASQEIAAADDDGKAALKGVWVAQSMEADGKSAPATVVKRGRFTFKDDKLLIRGNFDNDREDECDYQVNSKQSPKHLDFTPPKEKKPILAIYKIKGDELKICIRHASSPKGRPTEFATKDGSRLILMVFKRQK